MESIAVEVINWGKFNPRKDYKRPSWFALSNRILEDSALYRFTADEFRAWIYILCQASQKNSGVITLYFDHADRACRVNKRSLLSAIEKLKEDQSLKILEIKSVQDLYANVQETNATLHNRTVQNITNNNAHPDGFASFYSGYPRKVGKSKAEKAYRRDIKSTADHDLLIAARDRYRSHCDREKIESKFILHCSTFMNQWRDWLDPDAGKSESFAQIQETGIEKYKRIYGVKDGA